ncbi:hypothetical protein HDU79_005475 [Rhizoclosmatium sp. JEL0117]|nr:hypothetical protein HDU79_005475 [Rhizoclosmatium sp. JEL0117]
MSFPSEQTPLLLPAHPHALRRRSPAPPITKATVLAAAKEMVPMAWPVSLGYLLQSSLNMAAIVAQGQLGTNNLASMALATLFANVTGYSLIVGMGAAIDTLCSQAYGEYLAGTGDKKELGRHLSRAIFINYLLCIPITTLWLFTEPLLLLTGQDPSIAHLSGRYIRLLIPCLIPFVLSECVKRYLMAQGIMRAQMTVIGCVTPVNVFLQYLFNFTSWRVGENGEGSPFALLVSQCLIAGSLIAYGRFVKGGECFAGWEWKQVLNEKKLGMVGRLGVSGIFMTCSEWWAWEIVALLAGLLGPEYLAAQTIVLSASYWTYTLPMGFAIACTTRIGNALGSGKPDKAKTSAMAALVLGLFLAVLNSTFFMVGRKNIGYVFSDDESVIAIVSQIMPLVAAFQLADVMACICGGILRGAGRPDIGAYLNLIGYYILGIPFGVFCE